MSLFEQNLSNNHVSLEKLFANSKVTNISSKLKLQDLINITIRGG
jgi:hypothetical protein